MKTFKVGAYHVTRIEEMLTPGFAPEFLLPDFDSSIFEEHPLLSGSRFWDEPSGKVMSSMHSWLIRDDRHTILIDTGCGNDKSRALPLFQRFHQLHLPYLDRLLEAGVRPQDVTLVICTHLHIDHVGWNTTLQDGQWVPTFPNAKYIFSRREFEHWQSPTGGGVAMPENMAVIADSVLPVIEAGLVEFIDDGSKILDGLFFEDAVGHTAGHGMLKLESGRDSAIFPGDSLHQPMQVFRPDWNSRFCEMAEEARATRRSILDYCNERNSLLLPAHFGAPHGGYVKRNSSGYSFTPADDLVVAG
jgi:glyoxylase-like metal-dependent hydrolase (beta-lactamase superfamily II)